MNHVLSFVAAAFAAVTISTSVHAQEKPKTAEAKAVAASLKPAELEAAKLLLYSSVLSAEVGDIVEIPRDIQERYNSAAKTVGFSLPGGAIAVGTYYTFKSSLKEFESVMSWVNAVVAFTGRSLKAVTTFGVELSEKLGLVKLSGKLADSSGKVYEVAIEPVLKIIATRGVGYSLATVSGVGSLAASSYLIFNGPADALKYDVARNLFGYNAHLSKEIDQSVEELAVVFSLKPAEVVKVKDAVRAAIIEVAVKNEFRRDATYHVDLVEILAKKDLLTKEQIAAASVMRDILKSSTAAKAEPDEQVRLGKSVAVILATQAVLESMIDSGKLSLKSEKEARQMLANSKKTVKRIQENLVQY